MKIHGCGCLLHFNGHHWARRRSTPLWLSVKDQDWKVPPGLRMALAPLEIADPPHLLVGDNELLVPIFLPPSVEGDVVESAVLAQVREVADLLLKFARASENSAGV
jgi:hypothetical protein